MPCSASSATIAAPPMARRPGMKAWRSRRSRWMPAIARMAGSSRPPSGSGIAPSTSASATASAMPRSPSSRQPARSGWSWIATPPASNPTSRWSSSRSWRAAAISRSSTRRSRWRCRPWATTPRPSSESWTMPSVAARSRMRRPSTTRRWRRAASMPRRWRASRRPSSPPSTSVSPSRATRWATPSAARSLVSTRPRSPTRNSMSWPASASPRATSPRPTSTPAGP